MRSIPGMVVICPADDIEARQAVKAAYKYDDRHRIALCCHAVVERFQIVFRVNISDFLYTSELIAVVLEIVNAVFRLCHIQPEEPTGVTSI